VTEIRGRSQVMNSRLLEQKIEKHEIQKIGCDTGPKADEDWMSAETYFGWHTEPAQTTFLPRCMHPRCMHGT